MSQKMGVGRKFLRDNSGVATVEWVAATATFVILGIIFVVYPIFGDDDGSSSANPQVVATQFDDDHGDDDDDDDDQEDDDEYRPLSSTTAE